MEVPIIADSESGVSTTRASPNSSTRPCVTLKTPPSFPTSSPRTMTRGSFFISCLRARLTASTIVSLAMMRSSLVAVAVLTEKLLHLQRQFVRQFFERVAENVGRVRRRSGFLFFHSSFDLFARPCRDLFAVGFIPQLSGCHVPDQPLDRIALLPLGDIFFAPVARGVVRGRMLSDPVRYRFDERRTFSRAGSLQRLHRCAVHGEYVIPVDLNSGEPVGDRFLRQSFGSSLALQRYRDRPVVILAEENDG